MPKTICDLRDAKSDRFDNTNARLRIHRSEYLTLYGADLGSFVPGAAQVELPRLSLEERGLFEVAQADVDGAGRGAAEVVVDVMGHVL